ncbi:MAG: hypothetical protein ACLR56_11280 [Oscillospiraceae bacterium]
MKNRRISAKKNYTVRVFNLVSPENSDSWNSEEIQGDELMAQLSVM